MVPPDLPAVLMIGAPGAPSMKPPGGGMSQDLLASIQKGTKLKKASTRQVADKPPPDPKAPAGGGGTSLAH